MRSFLPAIALALALAPGGCSTAAEETRGTEQPVTHESAARGTSFAAKWIFDAAPATDAATRLGIARWQAYSLVEPDRSFDGFAAFATDDNADVRFSLVLDPKARTIEIRQYARDGVSTKEGIAEVTREVLFGELAVLRSSLELELHKRASDDVDCALRVGLGILAGLATAGLAAWLGIAAAGAYAVAASVAAGAVADFELFGAALGMTAGNGAVFIGGLYADLETHVIEDTYDICRRAFRERL